MIPATVDRTIHDAVVNAAAANEIELFHGYTTSAHPAACAASLAALAIYEREKLFERGAALSGYFQEKVFSLADLPVVTDIRTYGLVAGVELKALNAPGQRGYQVQKELFDAGLHLKTTGDVAILAPALVAENQHIDEIVDVLRRVLSRQNP